jgi:hypothetical protein
VDSGSSHLRSSAVSICSLSRPPASSHSHCAKLSTASFAQWRSWHVAIDLERLPQLVEVALTEGGNEVPVVSDGEGHISSGGETDASGDGGTSDVTPLEVL